MSLPQIKLHVFSDYICPFCYIGSGRLLRLRNEFDIRINWCHVEIHPEIPEQGMDVYELGYSENQWQAMNANLLRLAEEDGLTFHAPSRIPRSQKALLLSLAAREQGSGIFYPLHEAIFEAYFRDGRDIGDEELLRNLALGAGMEEDDIEDAWRDQEYQERLNYNLNLARQLGIHSTPTFVIGDSVLVGTQPLQRLRQALQDYSAIENRIGHTVH
jgi:predicted DsbA family dithiol-disulfide isomerase